MTGQGKESRFSFLTPELTHRVELILHLLEYSNHLVIVKGEHESGKSTLCDELYQQDEANLILRKLSVSTHTTTNDIFKAIIEDSDKDKLSEAAYEEAALNQWLERCHNKQQILALLIDNVDLLSDELINALFEILTKANSNSSTLHFCLFCDPSFLERLDEPGISHDESRSLHIIEMPSLSEKQTEQYIHNKYPEIEAANADLFDEKTIKQIHRLSHGMPGRINALCEQYLDDPAKKTVTAAAEEKPKLDVKALLVENKLIIVIAASLLLLSVGITTLLHKAPEEQTETQRIKLNLPNKNNEKVEQAEIVDNVPPPTTKPSAEVEPVTIEELSPPVIPKLNDDVNNKTEVTVYNAQGQIIAKESDLEKIIATEKEVLVAAEDVTTNVVETVEEAVIKPKPVKVPPPPPSPPAPKPKPVKKEVVKAKEPVVKDINWLVKQSPKKYVLQLIGAYEKDTINVYLKSFNKDDDKIIPFSASNKGKQWHVLVYGLYANREAAVAAIDTLPTKAKLMAPWPRTVESIKELLKKE